MPARGRCLLRTYLDDRSSIVKTAAMHGLADLTRHDPSLLPEVLDMLRILWALWDPRHARPWPHPA